MASHEEYMLRAVDLAWMAAGTTRTNPMVGAVIVYNDRIIGEGFHTAFGKDHAEVAAFRSVSQNDQKYIPKSSMYVTLEPCSHHGKTPPCSLRIIKEGIQNVYIGCRDPFPKVDGAGIKILEEAGIKIVKGIAEKACLKLLHRFHTQIQNQRSYIHLKWAQSSDGYMGLAGEPTPITDPQTAFVTHKLRAQNDAILVGTVTLLTDNPSLDNRLYPGPTPTKLILDRKGHITHRNYNFFNSTGQTWGLLPENSPHQGLYDDVILIPPGLSDSQQLEFILEACYQKKLGTIFVEGGSNLLTTFIKHQLWDQADILRSHEISLGKGITAPLIKGQCVQKTIIGPDEWIRFYPDSINVKDYLKPA